MLPWLGERWGNPSSVHAFGQAARAAVEGAREEVAALLGARPLEIVFHASGTEALNAVVAALGRRGGRLVLSGLEHPAVVAAAARVASLGVEVRTVAPAPSGVMAAAALLAEVTPETSLVALQLANNELGTLQPVAEVARACRALGVPVLCDAVQAVGKLPVEVGALGVDYLVLAGHKFHGPLGAAALWLRDGAPFEPLLVGGSQERQRRASTVNVPAVVGLGAAAALARAELPARRVHLAMLRDRCEAGLRRLVPDLVVHGEGVERLPNVSHLACPGIDAHALMLRLDLAGWAVSTGAACASGSVEPSRVLLAIGMSRREALASLRLSFGMPNSAAEVDAFLPVFATELAALRAASMAP